jgi:hypothetical protein
VETRKCGVCILAFVLLKAKMSFSRGEYVERFANYDAQFNQMEAKMEVLERDNTILREALVTYHMSLGEMEEQVHALA